MHQTVSRACRYGLGTRLGNFTGRAGVRVQLYTRPYTLATRARSCHVYKTGRGLLVGTGRQFDTGTFILVQYGYCTCILVASFPGPTKERRGPGTHCSRMRGLHGNQVAGVIGEAQTELVYL